jgi:hypothetical protein
MGIKTEVEVGKGFNMVIDMFEGTHQSITIMQEVCCLAGDTKVHIDGLIKR